MLKHILHWMSHFTFILEGTERLNMKKTGLGIIRLDLALTSHLTLDVLSFIHLSNIKHLLMS